MPSEHLTCLRNLHEYYLSSRDLAIRGDWASLTQLAEHGHALFGKLQQTSSGSRTSERTEAKRLLTEILEADKQVRSLASFWLADVEPLLRVLNKSR